VTIAPESLPDDIAALKRIIADMASDATAAQAEITKLKFQLARYRRAAFGRSSEKLAREGEQLELAIEALEEDQGERTAASPAVAAIETAATRKPARRPLPDHLPLYRQAEIFAREGVNLETSTLSGWVGATAAALQPLVDALAADVMGSQTLHVDDTPVPVLAPGTGKTKTGRLWTPACAGAGSMSATSGRLPAAARRLRCSSIRPTARASIRRST
jgi:hypothetical protein